MSFSALSQPNIKAEFITESDPNIKLGEYLRFSFKIKNIGSTSTNKSHTSIYLSPTTSFNDAVLLNEISTEAIAANSETQKMDYVYPIPFSFDFGNYYIIIITDSRHEVIENVNNEYFYSTSSFTINDIGIRQNLPYPVLLIHGLTGSDKTWFPFLRDILINYGYSYGGNMDFCLNQDGDKTVSTLPNDFKEWSTENDLGKGDFYTINFDINAYGTKYSTIKESNQSGIVKQGLAIQKAIGHILNVTKRDKVILVGHSMGGLAARQYLQNSIIWQPDFKHHIAKLHTTGTPHGGSNATMFGIGATEINEKSEAVRDLKRSYAISGDPGVFLFGGVESNFVMWNNAFINYENIDVNCNGVVGNTITGLNQKNLPIDLPYSFTIGIDDSYPTCTDCDGVVGTYYANLNNYYGINGDTFICRTNQNLGIENPLHLRLPDTTSFIMKGIDEPALFKDSYLIGLDTLYFGNFTEQSKGSQYIIDYDDYKFTVPLTQMVNIKLFNIPISNCKVEIFDISNNSIYSYSANGKGFININMRLNAGTYFIEISALPDNIVWHNSYAFKISLTNTGICPYSNFVISSSLTGATYQWQVDNGNGYTNLANTNVYNGVNLKTLELISPPTNMYGYKYRCLVNGTSLSNELMLKFSVQWIGEVNNKWENPLNWNCGVLPDANTDVIINTGVPYYPIVTTNQSCRSIRALTSSVLKINSGLLNITGK
ncbi:MAG: CARDB domain-containing protein [Bacteroidota bacterium]